MSEQEKNIFYLIIKWLYGTDMKWRIKTLKM